MLPAGKILWALSMTVATGGLFACAPPETQTGDHASRSMPIEQVVSAPVEVSELKVSFHHTAPSDVVYALNEVKKSPLDYEVIEAVSCAYSACEKHAKEWSWDTLSKPVVRINLIDVLLQANRRGMPTIDEQVLKSEVVALLSEPNPLVVQQSLLILSYLDDRNDVALISRVARETTNSVTFRVAMLALREMTSDEAAEAFSNVMEEADADQRAAVADLVKE